MKTLMTWKRWAGCGMLALLVLSTKVHATPDIPDPSAEHWRAVSRFGYGPSASATAGEAQGRAWALAELERARIAAQQPAAVPEAMRGFEVSLPELYAQDKADDAQRRERLKTLPPGEPQPVRLATQLAQQAANWQLAACSRPTLENPLLARMTEFWFNHLNVSTTKDSVRPYVGHYVLNVIRAHALGRFEDLLLASARHPAMLFYLDQVDSVAETNSKTKDKRGLNENYARELMELHTLGVHGGYTQQDVRELARMLTGWTTGFENHENGFRFAADRHDQGEKTWLGQQVQAQGVAEGEEAIRRLARHPATAQRISWRLAQWFVADTPPPALVQRLAQRYLDTGGDIAAVMRSLIESPETWDSQYVLFKTPMDFTCSTMALLGGADEARLLQRSNSFLRAAGQGVHTWLTPDGYPTDAAHWLSPEALTRRADFAFVAGRQLTQMDALTLWLSPQTWQRIQKEPAYQQAGLALSSPEWMYK